MLLFLLETLDDNDDKLLFSELYHEYKKKMLYAAYQILHDQDKSEDAVQQAFINIINQFSVIKKLNPQQIKPYFITAAKNTAKIYYVQKKNIFCLMIFVHQLNPIYL